MGTVNSTSLRAYGELIGTRAFQPREHQILEALAVYAPLTRDDLAELTGLRLSSVCGRVRSLYQSGAIETCGMRRSTATGKMQELLRVRQ